MSDLAAYLGAAVLVALASWAFAIDRRGGGRPLRRAAVAFTLTEGCSLALLAPNTVALGHTGLDGLTVIAFGDTVRCAALTFLMLVACLLNPRPARRHSPARQAVVAVAVQAGMTLLFLASRPTLDGAGILVTGPDGRWPLAVRVVVFAGYSVWALAELFWALLPAVRTAATGALRWGVRLILAAVCVGVVWTLWSYDDFVRVLRYGALDGSEDTVSNSLGALCAALVVAGALVGRGSVTFGATARRLRLCRLYLALGPLWSALHEAMPQIAFPQTGRPLLARRPAGIELALYRRVIEIHDGRLVLRPYHHPAVAAWLAQAGPAQAADAALVEAATIAAALANMRGGRRFGNADTGDGQSAEAASGGAESDLDSEAQWLSRVARALRRSPVIPELLEHLRQDEGGIAEAIPPAVPTGT